MPAETVEWIIGRALTDLAYRQRLLGSPDEALAGYDLTAEQTIEIKAWTRQQFDELIHWLDEKVSQAVIKRVARLRVRQGPRSRHRGESSSLPIWSGCSEQDGWTAARNQSNDIERAPVDGRRRDQADPRRDD